MTNSKLQSYILGFAGSVLATLIAYLAVVNQWLTGSQLVFFVLGLGLLQLLIQLVFFLHLGTDRNSRSYMVIFVSTFSLVLVVIVGSLWIMDHLNYHMTGTDAANYLLEQEGIRK